MKHLYYEVLIAPYKERQRKRMLIALAVMVAGFLLVATVIGGIVGLAAWIYLMLEMVKTFALFSVRKKSLAHLEKQGKKQQVMDSLQFATRMELDGVTYAWTDEYLCLPHGVILPLNAIAWIYLFTQKVSYMMIPIMKMNSCKVRLIDGKESLVFYGKAKNKQAFAELLSALQSKIPHLLIGNTPENQAKYKEMVAAYNGAKQ